MQIYSAIKRAIAEENSFDSLVHTVLPAIATLYQAEVILWADLNRTDLGALHIYATPNAWTAFDTADWIKTHATPNAADEFPATPDSAPDASPLTLLQFQAQAVPDWMAQYQQAPPLVQLETGALLLSPPDLESSASSSASQARLPAFFLQLQRSPQAPDSLSDAPYESGDGSWTPQELEALPIIAAQIDLAYSTLIWKRQLQQAHQQTAMMGRIAHLINSSLNPDEIVNQILADVGQNLGCDRCMVFDLRHGTSQILATWEQPSVTLTPLQGQTMSFELWQDVVDMFLQGGTSYLKLHQEEDSTPLSSWLTQMGAASALVFPLFVMEEFWGAIALLTTHPHRVYGVHDLQVVRQVSDQLAIALLNAPHYQHSWYKQDGLRLHRHSPQFESIRDQLTQLLNRHSLEQELDQLSAQAVWAIQAPFSILVCDIDYFKLINDSYGHLVGDEVLKGLAQMLQQQLRRNTAVYRYGGEEFVAILAETPQAAAMEVAERLRRTIRSNPVKTSAGALDVTASFGVAQQHPERDLHARDVIARAEQALFQAKCRGRDRVESL